MEFRIPLSTLCKSAYKINPEQYLDYDNYYFNHSHIYKNTYYDEKIKARHPHLSDDDIDEIIKNVMIIHYESTYIDECYHELCRQLEDKIKKDFKVLNTFFKESCGEIEVKDDLTITDINWKNDYIEFKGPIKKLASYCINAINGWGMFYYNSITEFFQSLPAETLQEKIQYTIDHLHWLNKLEEIYGTVYGLFKFDTQYIDYYGTLGDYSYTDEEIDEYIEEWYLKELV
jgi:hypothetical protein